MSNKSTQHRGRDGGGSRNNNITGSDLTWALPARHICQPVSLAPHPRSHILSIVAFSLTSSPPFLSSQSPAYLLRSLTCVSITLSPTLSPNHTLFRLPASPSSPRTAPDRRLPPKTGSSATNTTSSINRGASITDSKPGRAVQGTAVT